MSVPGIRYFTPTMSLRMGKRKNRNGKNGVSWVIEGFWGLGSGMFKKRRKNAAQRVTEKRDSI